MELNYGLGRNKKIDSKHMSIRIWSWVKYIRFALFNMMLLIGVMLSVNLSTYNYIISSNEIISYTRLNANTDVPSSVDKEASK